CPAWRAVNDCVISSIDIAVRRGWYVGVVAVPSFWLQRTRIRRNPRIRASQRCLYRLAVMSGGFSPMSASATYTEQSQSSVPGGSDERDIVPGTRRMIAGEARVFYGGYWIKAYDPPADTLTAKKHLIEALTRRLFNHVEHGLNIPGTRL